jgi:hypothetical protein
VLLSSMLRNPFSAAPWGWRRLTLTALALMALAPAASIAADPAGQFEKPPVLQARDLVPATLLSGEGFHVDDAVPTDGLMALFTLHTELGTLQVHGIELLRIRVAEVPAMLELAHESKTKVFAQALARTGAEPIKAAGQMVMHPVDTVKGLPGGVGRFFGRVGLGAQRIKEAATEPEEAPAGEKAAEVAKRTGQTTRDILGYEQERRQLAKRLHVDPYTTNPILSKQLDEFTVVAFRAHVAVTTTISVVVPGSMAITATRITSNMVWDTPKADLIVRNEKTLEEMHVPPATIKTFMRNTAFPLSVQTAFVEDLHDLSKVAGAVDVVTLASTAESEDQARFLADCLDMMSNYSRTHTPVARIIARGTVVGRDSAGAIVVPAAVDYASWTSRTSYFANRPDLAAPKRSVWLTGQMSPLAKKNFLALAWQVNEKTSLRSATSAADDTAASHP